jgi:ubiquinone/menaquinone biosynthesis C-methylase UbiE
MIPRVLEPEVMDTAEEADGYDAMDHTGPNEAFVQRLVELEAHGCMLDIGTGPGHIPLLVCERISVSRIVGIDLSTHMLRHAERHRQSSRHRDRIEFRLGDAKGLRFDDGVFDVVFSNTILHHIPAPAHFLAEARRVLRPGGVFLVRDLYRPESHARVKELVAQHASTANAYQQELFRASLCAALTPAELREAADKAGLEDAHIVLDSDRHMSLQIRRGGNAG